jgi:predicted phosphodiesterase
MKLGLIADIHGNLVALDAVLADLASDQVDRLVCLGDSALLGPRPAEVIARLRQLDCPSVLGNVDAWMLGDTPPVSSNTALPDWNVAQLTDADFAYLRACPMTLEIVLDSATTLLACHGTQRSYYEVIAAGTPPDDMRTLLGEHRPAFVAGGHTHRQLLRRDGETTFINPGSVGLPGVGPDHPLLELNQHIAWAEYAVLEVREGRRSVDLRRIPLDLDRMFADARASGMPDLDWWLGLWQAS